MVETTIENDGERGTMKPLDDVLVLDLSRVLSGPYCTMALADMGARVVKVERPGKGDDTRSFGPPFIEGESAYFMSVNRNKQSVTLNIKHPRGRELLWRMVERADVLVENFRPGVLDRLGFSYSACADRNPGLIYCSISGFGHHGLLEFARKPGYDVVIQGLGGLQSLTGPEDGPPYKVGTSIADLIAGLYAVQGILLALLARARTGKGQRVDISMLDGQVSLLTYQAGIYFATGQVPARMGNRHPTIAPYETVAVRDGYMNLAVGNDTLWEAFCKAAEIADLRTDPRFRTNRDRVTHRTALFEVIGPVLRQHTLAEWVERLDAAGVPCGPVLDLHEVLNHPQIRARDMVVTQEHPVAGTIRSTGIPVRLSDTPGDVGAAPPVLGQHTNMVFQDLLGLSKEDLERLEQEGVV